MLGMPAEKLFGIATAQALGEHNCIDTGCLSRISEYSGVRTYMSVLLDTLTVIAIRERPTWLYVAPYHLLCASPTACSTVDTR